MDGFLCVNKPVGPSSFQIVHQVRRALGIKKTGHAGTLDPQASGLLVLALGNATRLLQYLPNEPKIYRFSLQFGTQTDTFDREGAITHKDGLIPHEEQLIKMVREYEGELMQVPPAYSAIKVNGVRAYKLARQGECPELKARPVTLFSFKIISYVQSSGIAELEVCCSGGTYVRSIVRDLAIDLGTFAFATSIHRVSSGDFNLTCAMGMENLPDARNYIIPVAAVFAAKETVSVTEEQKTRLTYGIDLSLPEMAQKGIDTVFAYFNKDLLAVLQRKEADQYHPATVFTGNR